MSAIACLRILLDNNRTDVSADRLEVLVAKYANIFLEVRWTLPRRYQQLTPYSYLLTDPWAADLDTAELAHLSHELQARLFGTGEENAVKLVLFEGDQEAISAFASLSSTAILAALQDPSELPGAGRLRRIAPDGALIDLPEAAKSPKTAEAFCFGPTIDGAQGIYFPKGGAFIGDVLSCTPVSAPTYFSMADGEDHRPDDAEAFDAACVMTASRFLVETSSQWPLYIPVAFSSLVRPALREAWLDLAAVLPTSERARLAASVYDVPRSPTYPALKTIRASLDPYFAAIDLCVGDPDFQIEDLAERAVASVTLRLPESSLEVRLTTLRRFADHASDYRRRRMVAGVTNIRLREERDLAINLGLPFLSGPGVCRVQPRPVGGTIWSFQDLPLRSAAIPSWLESSARVGSSRERTAAREYGDRHEY